MLNYAVVNLVSNISFLDIDSELNESTWNYKAELVIILMIAIIGLPANLFLILFSLKKIAYYRPLRHHLMQARIANSFHIYLIEMCFFDTVIIIYLIINAIFKVLHYFEKTPYESLYDISNFACKIFTFTVRISSAMSNYLVFFLSLTRHILFYCKNQKHYEKQRLCFNTKYLSIYLFCLCTIANVFRLEILNVNNESEVLTTKEQALLLSFHQELIQPSYPSQSECGPNQQSLKFDPNDDKNISLFWSILVYNILFVILPLIGNFVFALHLVRKRKELIIKLDDLIKWKKNPIKNVEQNTDDSLEYNMECETPLELKLNVFQVEYLKTCSASIAFSLSHVILVLPYTLVELINQFKFNMTLSYVSQYLTYVRYVFFCLKFYLLFLCNFKFRRDFFRVFEKKSTNNNTNSSKLNRNITIQRNSKKEMFQRFFSKRYRTRTILQKKRNIHNLTNSNKTTQTSAHHTIAMNHVNTLGINLENKNISNL